MFALCHFKDETNSFVLFDKKDIAEVTKEINIEVEKDLFRKEKEEESARIIQKIFRQKRSKVKLYIGYDSSEYTSTVNSIA